MNLIQGSNAPIRIKIANVPTVEKISEIWGQITEARAVLYGFKFEKVWEKPEMQIDEDTVVLPMTQEDTISFSLAPANLEFKFLFEDNVFQIPVKAIVVERRKDKHIIGDPIAEGDLSDVELSATIITNLIKTGGGSVEGGSIVTTNGIKQTTWESNTKQDAFSIGENLEMTADKTLNVKTTNDAEKDNTLPITSAGVFTTVGNIKALLETI